MVQSIVCQAVIRLAYYIGHTYVATSVILFDGWSGNFFFDFENFLHFRNYCNRSLPVFRRQNVKLKFDILGSFTSRNIVNALVLSVSRMNARAFIVQRRLLIRVEDADDTKSTTSTPPLVWSYNLMTSGFLIVSLVTRTVLCIVVNTTTFFFPVFFLSMYETNIIFSSLLSCPYKYIVDFSSRPSRVFNSFVMPFRSRRIVPIIVILCCVAHRANGTEVKYLSTEMLHPWIEFIFDNSSIR